MQDLKHPPQKNIIVRFLSGMWRTLTFMRQATLNLLFLIIVIAIIASVVEATRVSAPQKAPLLMNLDGVLVDQITFVPASQQLLKGNTQAPNEIALRTLINTIHKAETDTNITGLILQLDYFLGGGVSKMRELGHALERFKTSGKPVIAISDTYSQQSYFLAAYADEIYMHDMGNILLTGLGLYRNYYKTALDKLAVNVHVFKVGEFKDFVEPYIRDNMSDASKTHHRQWLDQLWATYTQHIETQRELPEQTIDQLVVHIDERMGDFQGDMAQLALSHKLVDTVGSRQDMEAALVERFGQDEEGHFKHIPYLNYQTPEEELIPLNENKLALINARGTILDGYQPAGSIGGDSLSELIQQAREDNQVKALVLRIDSGGGSAFASELIRKELEVTREAGKPVVISMGSIAASGGYWIAMASDEIWATPETITGSIGVFGIFPTFEKSLEKIGVETDGIGTTDLADALRADRALHPKAAAAYQTGVEAVYDRFLSVVSNHRDKSPDEIHAVAQGRVWTGEKALELGLVDKLGSLEDALASAAKLANLTDYDIQEIKAPLTTQEMIMQWLMEETHIQGLLPSATLPAPVSHILADWQTLQALSGTSYQRNTYALCLDCSAL